MNCFLNSSLSIFGLPYKPKLKFGLKQVVI